MTDIWTARESRDFTCPYCGHVSTKIMSLAWKIRCAVCNKIFYKPGFRPRGTDMDLREAVDWLTMRSDEAYREKATHRRYTQKEIAREMGISYGHLCNALSGSVGIGRKPMLLLERLVEREAGG